ncbi:MAG: ABC transporter substrate-binding protein, partial [Eubacterium sp.]
VIRALDRQTYADSLLHGTFEAGKAPIPPSLDYGFDSLKDQNAYNVESAKKLLAEAGYSDTNGDGIVEKDGQNLSLQYVIYDSRAELPILATATQANLKEIGIDVKVETYEYTTLLDMQENGEYDLLIWNVITANTGDPENYLKEYWKTHSDSNKNANTAGYSNAQLDAVFDTLSTEFDTAKRQALIVQAQQIIMDDAASIFYAYPETNIISSKKIAGVQMLPADYYWLTKEIKPAQ